MARANFLERFADGLTKEQRGRRVTRGLCPECGRPLRLFAEDSLAACSTPEHYCATVKPHSRLRALLRRRHDWWQKENDRLDAELEALRLSAGGGTQALA